MFFSLTHKLHLLKHGPLEHVGHVLLLKHLEGLPDASSKVSNPIGNLHLSILHVVEHVPANANANAPIKY